VDETSVLTKVTGSKVLSCKINDVNMNIFKYLNIMEFLYSITNVETILQNTILNVVEYEKSDKGYKYYTHLGVSVQGANSKKR